MVSLFYCLLIGHLLESPTATEEQKYDAIQTMKELAPSVIAIGLHKHVRFNNPKAEQILIEEITNNR